MPDFSPNKQRPVMGTSDLYPIKFYHFSYKDRKHSIHESNDANPFSSEFLFYFDMLETK